MNISVGQVFNSLTVLSLLPPDLAECVCSCGTRVTQRRSRVWSGHVKSCGCLHERHGESCNTGNTAEYHSWNSLNGRCYNPKNKSFKRYGARGITVCDQWRNSFSVFLADVGRRPSPDYSIERKNNSGNYEPSNCKWATPIEQANNRRSNVVLEFRGERKTLAQWVSKLGLDYARVSSRLRKNGWSVDRAFTTPRQNTGFPKGDKPAVRTFVQPARKSA